MRRPLSETAGLKWWQVGLTACLLGAIATPLGYIAIGAPMQFPPMFLLVFLPIVIVNMAYALYRSLRAPRAVGSASIIATALLALGLLVIAGFLYAASNFTLMVSRERFGLLATLFLIATLCCLPLAIWRHGALRERVSRLSPLLGVVLLLLILSAAGSAALLYATGAPAFI